MINQCYRSAWFIRSIF